MKLFESFILGVLQGIAEFLPISSSGHLLIAQEIMNVNYQGNVLEVATHLGTLLSIIAVFRNEIISLITGLKNKKITGCCLDVLDFEDMSFENIKKKYEKYIGKIII